MKEYLVNEVYLTIHGEGVRYGITHVFVRLAKCNLTCGFCDTEYESYTKMTADQIVAEATRLADTAKPAAVDDVVRGQKAGGKPLPFKPCRNVLFCGGEPLLQLDPELVAAFKAAGWFLCVETNGTMACPDGVDWITCSPKVAEHAISLERANELKYVRGMGQGIPHPKIPADHYLISPMFDGDRVEPRVLDWCVGLVKNNPPWRLTVQHHKASFGGVR